MSRAAPLLRIPVGVVVERRKAKSPWVDFVWRPVAVLPGVPDAAPWTVLDGDADRVNFYAGTAEIELYRSEPPVIATIWRRARRYCGWCCGRPVASRPTRSPP